MNTRSFILNFSFLIFSLSFVSCTLEREDYTEITPDNFMKTESDLRLAANSLYYEFGSGYWNGEGIYGAGYGGYQVVSDMTTDVLWTSWGWESDDLYYQQWHAAVTGDIANHCWQNFAHYQFLSKARNTIRRIEDSEAPEAARRHYAAEVRCLRGWMALYLYDLFGPVPVASDEVLDSPEEYIYIPRLTDEEYDAMMESDLRTAIDNLPEVAEARGRVTKGAAMMILLKYYMIRGKFTEAEALARQLVELEGRVYTLQPNYASVFSKAGVGNSEIILQVTCNSENSWTANYVTAECLPSDMAWTDKSTGWGGWVMPWAFFDTFESGDSRRALLVDSYTNIYGKLIDRANPNGGQLTKGALPLKYGPDPDMTGAQSGIDLVVYRYSDVLLTLAECIVRNTNTVASEAVTLVDRVRARASLPGLPATQTASVAAFMDALLLERGHEFFLEGLRRQDLIRFKAPDGVSYYVKKANERIAAAMSPTLNTVDSSHDRFWIPQDFIDESKSAIVQNPGY